MVDAPKNRFRVLLLADEPGFLAVARAALAERVDLVLCGSSRDALALLEKERFHVVASDIRVGGSRGTDFLRKVLPTRGTTSCLLVTEASELGPADWKDLPREIHVLRKPISEEKLSAMVIRLAEVSWAEQSIRSLDSAARGKPDGSH